MPTWVLLVALVAFPTVVHMVGYYAGVEPYATIRLTMAASGGPLTVLISRVLATSTTWPAARLPVWAEWTITMAPLIVAAAMLAWALYRSAHEDHTGPTPASWCARCDTALYADQAGGYYSVPGGHLCPPELRQAGVTRARKS